VAEKVKLKLNLCDASPAALCNAFRFNYGDIEDCTMLLDIGAKTSNLLFFEKGKVFSRSINLGANVITQDFGNDQKLKFAEAEKLKIAEGFVSLGGAYEEPENPNQAAISKIARQFMTKLHIQVNQTIQFYRGQQGGTAPQRLFLSGGASIMPYTAQFFAEKLNVPVEYFNPFRNVQIDPAVNLEELSRVAHSLGEVVGLGLRNLAHCPVEMNLMPESTLRWQAFNQKKPYFIGTIFSLVLVAFATGYAFSRLADQKEATINDLNDKVTKLQAKSEAFKKAYGRLQTAQAQTLQLTALLEARYHWGDVFMELRRVLIVAEENVRQKMSAQKPNVEAGIWIEKIITDENLAGATGGMPSAAPAQRANPESTGTRGTRGRRGGADNSSRLTATSAPVGTAQGIQLYCRAVDLTEVDTSAKSAIAFEMENQFKTSPLFDPKATQLSPTITPDPATHTFSFGLTVALQNPLKL
jgi:hypothetical protein